MVGLPSCSNLGLVIIVKSKAQMIRDDKLRGDWDCLDDLECVSLLNARHYIERARLLLEERLSSLVRHHHSEFAGSVVLILHENREGVCQNARHEVVLTYFNWPRAAGQPGITSCMLATGQATGAWMPLYDLFVKFKSKYGSSLCVTFVILSPPPVPVPPRATEPLYDRQLF